MKKLAIFYYSSGRLAIEVENGITRNASGSNAAEVIKSMNADDLGVLVAFCKSVIHTVEKPNQPSIFLIK